MLMAHAERVPALPSEAAQLLAQLSEFLEFQWSDDRGGPLPLEQHCGRQIGLELPGHDRELPDDAMGHAPK
jgi:hypothetical protein